MREFHHKWRQLTEEIEQNAGGIVPVIKEDFEKRTLVANALNFFEEIGYAARVGAADLEALRSVIGALSLKYFKITRPWIEYRRETDHIPTAWSNYEWLCDRWKNS